MYRVFVLVIYFSFRVYCIKSAQNMVRANANKLRQPNNRMHRSRRISNSLRNQEIVIRERVQNSNLHHPQNAAEDPQPSTEMKLRLWAVKHNITRIAMSELLKILISIGLTYLPHDPRTLLETPQNIQLHDRANGKVWYCGIENNLRRIFHTLNEDLNVLLNFNIDGIPLFNTAKHEFWPILANIYSK